MRRREACPSRTREVSRPERLIDGHRSFAHVGKSRFLTVASPGVTLRTLPTRAKSRPLLYVDTRRAPGRLEFPLGQALAAPGQEDGNGIGRADHTLPHLEEALDQLHRLDIRHGAEHDAPEALSGGAELPAPR